MKGQKTLKPRYTEALHAHRVYIMMNNPGRACYQCPAQVGFWLRDPWNNAPITRDWLCDPADKPCRVCREFIGLPYQDGDMTCPCTELGTEEAITRTHLALEQFYGEEYRR